MVFLRSASALRNAPLKAAWGRSAGAASAVFSPAHRLPRRRSDAPSQGAFREHRFHHFSSMAGGGSTVDTSESKFYTVGITGAGGLIGTAFQNELAAAGRVRGKPVRVVTLARGAAAEDVDAASLSDAAFASAKTVAWHPHGGAGAVDAGVLRSLDALVHLGGENIATGEGLLAPLGLRPWTDSKKREILASRTVTTAALADALAASGNARCDFLVAGGVGVYGSDFVGEDAAPAATEEADVASTSGFLADVSRAWEAAAAPAGRAGNRVVRLRNGVVLSTKGGALAKLYPVFWLGGGGVVGGGQQYFPHVSCRDMARAMVHVLETPALEGPVNMCAPEPATNAEFTRALGAVLGRPTVLPLPAFAVSLLFGEMGEEVLLGGTRAAPKKLLDSGFRFRHPTVEEALRSAVEEETEI